MKIGILTQPLHTNYGGLLQAFALQKVLSKSGHEVWTVDLPFRKKSKSQLIKEIVKNGIKKFILNRDVKHVIPFKPTIEQKKFISKHTNRFILENIRTTESIPTINEIAKLKKYNFEAYVVGSDQVWRPQYSPGIEAFFLDFLQNDPSPKKISYAASLGVDNWEFSAKQTRTCSRLAQSFNAISVREDSAQALCRKHLKTNAEHVLDPTLLLEKEEYITLVKRDEIADKPNSLMLYVLDKSPEKMEIARKVEQELGLTINQVMPESKLTGANSDKLDQCVYPPVTAWIKGFMDAKYVVTDSFHGTVFSIIFNKPFIAIGNKGRGLTRFTSLLKLLNLEKRLIVEPADFDRNLIHEEINYQVINQKINVEKERSMQFLSNLIS